MPSHRAFELYEGSREKAGKSKYETSCVACRVSRIDRFRFIEDRRADYPVRILYDVLGVSPAGYYRDPNLAPRSRRCSRPLLICNI
jgi:hypothetical protein